MEAAARLHAKDRMWRGFYTGIVAASMTRWK
jgi:hypothetical protein